jgi:hypothetical protein
MATYSSQEFDDRNHYAFRFTDKPSNEQAYWLGWLATDGCVFKPTRGGALRISLALNVKDINLLTRYKEFVGARSLVFNKLLNSCHVTLSSDVMANHLKILGIIERKTHTLKISECLINNTCFWRGAFEGDGSIHKRKGKNAYVIQLVSASYEFLQQWCQFVKLSETYIYKNANHYNFQVSKKSEVIRILHTLYDGSTPDLRLERKYLLVDEALGDLDPNYALQWLQAKYGKGF